MKKILFSIFASVLGCMILTCCHDEEVTPARTPNILKVYLTKADFKAQVIHKDNGSSRISLLDDAMKRKVDSVLCWGGLGPNRLNILQDPDEAVIDQTFSALVEQVEHELTALNLVGSLCVYSREMQQYRADSTLNLCYHKLFGDEKHMQIVGYDISQNFSDDTKYDDDFIEEFGTPDPRKDWSNATKVVAEVRLPSELLHEYLDRLIAVYSDNPDATGSYIIKSNPITSEVNTFEFDVPKAIVCVYFLIRMPVGHSRIFPAMIEDGKCQVSFSF